ncbi:MAG: BrnT family toxin [Synergistaceae bacterium]|nr:BrnT family toxin [Synergistaceae bacterium]
MQFEWDENKRKINIEKHGIDFADAVKIFDGFTHKIQDKRADYGEDRFVTIGLLNGVEISVINTPRDGKIRIISVRRARVSERKKFYEEAEKIGYRF